MDRRFRTVVAAVACLFVCTAKAQVNLQVMHDFDAPFTTVEMYKGDKWGDTYFFIDHYYRREDVGGRTQFGVDSYYEFERGLNFWHDTRLRDFSLHLEFDFRNFGYVGHANGMACVGGRWALHNADFSRTATVALMYDHYIGDGSADIPLKFTATWTVMNLLGLHGLTFDGFLDVWGNDTEYLDASTGDIDHAHFSVHAQPQLWMGLSAIGIPNLHLGGEVVLGYNHRGTRGFLCIPCLGIKWAF